MNRREVAFRTCLIASYTVAAIGGLGWLVLVPSLLDAVSNSVGVAVIVSSAIALVVWPFAATLTIVLNRKRWHWALPGWFLIANPGALAGWLYIALNQH